MSDRSGAVLVLQHEAGAGPGNLAPWLAGAGLGCEVLDVPSAAAGRTDDLGAADELSAGWRAVVVLGSREAAYDDAVPWLAWELALLRTVVDAGTPVLGICFGAQLLARLEGGAVAPARTPERGWVQVSSEEASLAGSWLAWHGDEVTPPAGSDVAATSPACLQAFRTGPHLGVQFHPEVTAGIVAGWAEEGRRSGQLPDDDQVQALRAETDRRLPAATAAAHRLYADFLRLR